MDDSPQPRNRKERRAAAREDAKKGKEGTHLNQKHAEIPMAQPDRSGPKGKTLYEIAAERQAQLQAEGFYEKEEERLKKQKAAGYGGGDEFSDEPLGAFGEAVLYSVALTMLHFSLDVLVYNQYRQEIEWGEIWRRCGQVLPALFVVVYSMHVELAKRLGILRQLLFLGCAVTAGVYMVWSGNKKGYYAVMKRAPPIGTIWVWSVIEMDLPYALASLVAVIGYMWWNGFGAF